MDELSEVERQELAGQFTQALRDRFPTLAAPQPGNPHHDREYRVYVGTAGIMAEEETLP